MNFIARKPQTEPSADAVIDALRGSATVKKALVDRDAEIVRDRRRLVDELARREETAERDFPLMAQAIDAAMVEVRAAETKLKEAKNKVGLAVAAKSNASFAYQDRRQEIEAALIRGASPMIGQFVDEMRDEIVATRKRNFASHTQIANPITRAAKFSTLTNHPAVLARVAAAEAVIQQAEALRLEPDQSDIAAKLDQLRASLPAVIDVTLEGK